MKPSTWFGLALIGLLLLLCLLSGKTLAVILARVIKPEYDTNRQNSLPTKAISPSSNDQQEPAISSTRVVWSEKIEGYWQIVLFDLSDNSRHQLTFDTLDHVAPSISGDIVIWWEGLPRGPSKVAGVNSTTGQKLIFPDVTVANPHIEGTIVVWAGPIDIASRTNSIEYFDLMNQTSRVLTTSFGVNWPRVSGNISVWEDRRNEDFDVWGYDLSANQEFPIVKTRGDQERPDISGTVVVWQDNRNGVAINDYDIYGYDLLDQREFVISARGGNEMEPKVSHDIVVWTDYVVSKIDVYGFNLKTQTLFTVAADDHANLQPDVFGQVVVWTQAERPYDIYAHTQIMIGLIPGQP